MEPVPIISFPEESDTRVVPHVARPVAPLSAPSGPSVPGPLSILSSLAAPAAKSIFSALTGPRNFMGDEFSSASPSVSNALTAVAPKPLMVPDFMTPLSNTKQLAVPASANNNQLTAARPSNTNDTLVARPFRVNPVPNRASSSPSSPSGLSFSQPLNRKKKNKKNVTFRAHSRRTVLLSRYNFDKYLTTIDDTIKFISMSNPLTSLEHLRTRVRQYLFDLNAKRIPANTAIAKFLLTTPDEFVLDHSDYTAIDALYLFRRSQGVNGRFGYPYSIPTRCPDWTTKDCSHAPCFCLDLFRARVHCESCYKNWSITVLSTIKAHSLFKPVSGAKDRQHNALLRACVGAQQLAYVSNSELSALPNYFGDKLDPTTITDIRRRIGINGSFGEFHLRPHAIFGLDFSSTFETIWTKFASACSGTVDWVAKIAEMAKEFIKNFTSSFSSLFRSVIEVITNKVEDAFRWFGLVLLDLAIDQAREGLKKVIYTILGTMVFILLSQVGIFSLDLLSHMIGFRQPEVKLFAHASAIGASTAVLALTCLAVGVTTDCLKPIADQMRNLTAIVSGSTMCFGLAGAIFSFLPFSLRRALVVKFGTAAQIAKLDFEDWRVKAQTLIATAKISRVVGSLTFSEQLKDCLRQSGDLMDRLDSTVKPQMARIYFQLLNLSSIIAQYENATITRHIPYGIHLWGPGGIGKTSALRVIIQTLGYTERDCYSKPPSAAHWDGCVGDPKVVIKDEFLVGMTPDSTEPTEHLQLMSSAKFMPPLAALNEVAVGIKGTCVSPDVVITMNNSGWQVPPSFSTDGPFLRRRNLVAELAYNIEWYKQHPEQTDDGVPKPNLDLSALTDIDMETRPWLMVRLCNPHIPNKYCGIITWTQFLDTIKTGFTAHHEMNVRMGNVKVQEDNVEAIITKVSAEFFGFPTKTRTIAECVLDGIDGLVNFFKPHAKKSKRHTYVPLDMESVPLPPNKPPKAKSTPTRKIRPVKPQDRKYLFKLFSEGYEPMDLSDYTIAKRLPKNAILYEYELWEQEVKFLNEQAELNKPMDVPSNPPASRADSTIDNTNGSPYSSGVSCVVTDVTDQSAINYRMTNADARTLLKPLPLGSIEMPPANPLGDAVLHEVMQTKELEDSLFEPIKPLPSVLEVGSPNARDDSRWTGSVNGYSSGTRSGSMFSCFSYKDATFVESPSVIKWYPDIEEPVKKWFGFLPPRYGLENVMVDMIYKHLKPGCVLWKFNNYRDYAIFEWSTQEDPMTHYVDRIKICQGDDFAVEAFERYRKSAKGWEWFNLNVPLPLKISDDFLVNVTACFSLLALSYGLYCAATGKQEQIYWLEPHSGAGNETGEIKHSSVPKKQRNSPSSPSWNAMESNANPKRDRYTITVSGDNIEPIATRCISLGNFYVLAPLHVFAEPLIKNFSQDSTKHGRVYVQLSGYRRLEINMATELQIFRSDDFCVFKYCDPTFPNSSSIVRKFVSEADFNGLRYIESTYCKDTPRAARLIVDNCVIYSCPYASYNLQFAGRFVNPYLVAGDCGILFTSIDSALAGQHIGMYVAGGIESGVKAGLITVIFREQLEEAINALEKQTNFQTHANIISERKVPPTEIINMPTTTTIVKTPLNGALSVQSKKQPAVLRDDDPRTDAKITDSIRDRLDASNEAEVNEDLIIEIVEKMALNYSHNRNKKYALRRLTIEEAIGGIPGYLSSLKNNTALGFPTCVVFRGKGKTDAFKFVNGEVVVEQWFRDAVADKLHEMTDPMVEHKNRFIAYLKDELVSEEKIRNARTRLIYANDAVAVVAFRMIYGTLIASLNNSYATTPLAIGINQYSYDMDEIYRYLAKKSTKLIAGDFKNFDSSYHASFQNAAYQLFFELNEDVSTLDEDLYFQEHETSEPQVQVGSVLLNLKTLHCSGLLLTTIINCFVNEMYARYCFAILNPTLVFDDYIAMKVLGDDHIIAVADGCRFTPFLYRDELAKIGQVYTSDDKTAELTDEFRSFSKISFLGAIPRNLGNRYVGAPKKETLWQTPQWTTRKSLSNGSWKNVAVECVRLASLWDKTFFDQYQSEILGHPEIDDPPLPYYETQRSVANRTAASGTDYLRAHAGPPKGITTLNDEVVTRGFGYLEERPVNFTHGMNEPPVDIAYGPESLLFRGSWEWTTEQARGAEIVKQITLPGGLLNLRNHNNVQNMLFDRFAYCKLDIELVLQVAGTGFQQGLAVASIWPLGFQGIDDQDPGMDTFFEHQLIAPNTTGSILLKHNYSYYRNFLNTDLIAAEEQITGTFHIRVLSPLTTLGDDKRVTIALYSRFVNPEFRLPRQLPSTAMERLEFPTGAFFAEGNSTSANKTISIGQIFGHAPIQTTDTQSATQTVSPQTKADVSAIPLDNPPLLSGAAPIYNAFPGRSKTVGFHTAVGLQQHPEELQREHFSIARNGDTSVEFYCSRPTSPSNFKFNWKATDPEETILMSLPLNSILGEWSFEKKRIPSCLQPLNFAFFWRADFVFTFVAAKSSFHSGRLRATAAYAADNFTGAETSIFKNNIMDFTQENELNSVICEYNAPTEFMTRANRSGDGEKAYLDANLGTFAITVANKLVAPATVAQSIEVLVFVTLKNVRLREVASVPCVPAISIARSALNAHGPTGVIETEPQHVDSLTAPTSVELTVKPTDVQESAPCLLDIGRKFEYTWTDFIEIARRFMDFLPSPGVNYVTYSGTTTVGTPTWQSAQLSVGPPQFWGYYFYNWAGHVSYRIIMNVDSTIPPTCRLFYAAETETLSSTQVPFDGPILNDGLTITAAQECVLSPSEDMYPMGEKTWYIDVSCPYNNILNYLPITGDPTNKVGINMSYLQIRWYGPYTQAPRIRYSIKLGDDFRFFHPLPNHVYNPINNVANAIGVEVLDFLT